MPANKNEYLRYQILDKCLSNPSQRYTFKELNDKINKELDTVGYSPISDRTLRQDIKYLREEYSAPIKAYYDLGKPPYYRYEESDFSIFKPMSTAEAAQLADTVNLLNKFAGMPNMEWMESFAHKIESEFSINRSSKTVVGFDRLDEFKGSEFFNPIFEAIVSKQVLAIRYKPFDKEEFETIISPHYLRQYNNRWYVFGHVEELPFIPTYALDRIVSISQHQRKYTGSTIDYDKDFFNDVIGVTHNMDLKKERIILEVAADYENYFTSRPVYDGIRPVKGQPGQYYMDIIPNYELITYLVSHSDKIKVLSSETHYVENKVKERISDACKLWGIEPQSDKAEGSKA